MAKRRASNVDSDDDESVVESSPASKRARVADASDGERDDDTAVNEDGETEADKKFEEKYADQIRASMEGRQGVQGVSSELRYASID